MKIVVDSNRIIAALIKDSTTRSILLDEIFEFYAPEHIKDEIEKYKETLINKSKITTEEFNLLYLSVFENLTIIKKSDYEHLIEELKKEIKDIEDIPYLAVCLLKNAEGIWTHDPHFKEQNKIRVFTNIDMLKIIEDRSE